MEFVGNKNEIYQSSLPAFNKFPELNLSDFQQLFHFLSNETEQNIMHQMRIARASVNAELTSVLESFDDMATYSLSLFGDEMTAVSLYEQAVFSLTSSCLVGIQISNDTTAEAAERQEALSQKHDHSLTQYRRALDLLINAKETASFEVI